MVLNSFWVHLLFALLVSDIAALTLSAYHQVTYSFLCFSQSLQGRKSPFSIHGIGLQAGSSYLERGAQWIMVVSEIVCVCAVYLSPVKFPEHCLKMRCT